MKHGLSASLLAAMLAAALNGCATWNHLVGHKPDAAPATASTEPAPAQTAPVAAAPAQTQATAAAAAPRDPGMTVAQAQERLKALGYDCGKADGVIGKRTRAQLKRFQKAKGLPASGRLDDATLAALRAH